MQWTETASSRGEMEYFLINNATSKITYLPFPRLLLSLNLHNANFFDSHETSFSAGRKCYLMEFLVLEFYLLHLSGYSQSKMS